MPLEKWRKLVEEEFCLDPWVSGYMEAGRLTREGVKKYFERPNIKALLKDMYHSSIYMWEMYKEWNLQHGCDLNEGLRRATLTAAHCLSLMYYE